MYEYSAKFKSITDGDTLDVVIDLGFSLYTTQRVRIYGINAPELHSPDEKQRVLAKLARNHIIDVLLFNSDIIIQSVAPKDKYGRYLAKVFYTNSTGVRVNIGDELISKGLAVPYFGGKK